jgi:redox-sensitive bicupin YhaK (pirin superfamily)
MMQIRKSGERGGADHGWLKTHHSFSFADYYDPNFMGFRDLRVINEDRVAPGKGFPTHGHADMEIITYVTHGELEHQDSMGTKAKVYPGEVQRMSAGTGVRHSEYNSSSSEELKLLQIWIQPAKRGVQPGYGQKSFTKELDGGKLVLVVSQDGRDGSISINQDADLYAARPRAGAQLQFELRQGRYAWIQAVKGTLEVNGQTLEQGDAVAVGDEKLLKIAAKTDAELLLFDLN